MKDSSLFWLWEITKLENLIIRNLRVYLDYRNESKDQEIISDIDYGISEVIKYLSIHNPQSLTIPKDHKETHKKVMESLETDLVRKIAQQNYESDLKLMKDIKNWINNIYRTNGSN